MMNNNCSKKKVVNNSNKIKSALWFNFEPVIYSSFLLSLGFPDLSKPLSSSDALDAIYLIKSFKSRPPCN